MRNVMKVTIILPGLDQSGGNRVVAHHARLLHDAGHQVDIVVAGPRPLGLKQKIKRHLVELAQGTGGGPVKVLSHVEAMSLPIHRLDTYRPVTNADVADADVVIATWWETAEWVARLDASKGAKAYLVQHHEIFDTPNIARVRATYRLPLHKIAVAPWLVELMKTEYGNAEVDLVPNAIDKTHFQTPLRGKQALPTVGFMYSRIPFKGLPEAIATIRQLDAAVPALQVVSFGQERPEGLSFLGSRLHYFRYPTQDQIRDCYAGCDAWLLSSRSEGFGLPALEAMACRTPIVSTRTGWPASAVMDGVNGYLAEVGDVQGLAEGLRLILQSPEAEWQQLSRQALATTDELGWDHTLPLLTAALRRARRRQTPAPAHPGAESWA